MDDEGLGPLYDEAQFWESMEKGGLSDVFLKGHLWLERTLDDFLVKAMRRPQKLNLDRMTFSSKLNLCDALGLLSIGHVSLYRHVNKLRNQYAHQLTASIERDIHNQLLSISSPRSQGSYAAISPEGGSLDEDSPEIRLSHWFLVTIIEVGFGILEYEYHEKNEPALMALAALQLKIELSKQRRISAKEAYDRVKLPLPPHPRNVFLVGPPPDIEWPPPLRWDDVLEDPVAPAPEPSDGKSIHQPEAPDTPDQRRSAPHQSGASRS